MEGVRHLYVHLPFCVHRCGYCDFVTVVGRNDQHAAYVDALLLELERNAHVLADPIATVFVGGGTPTFTEPEALRRLLVALPAASEVTVEANPETVTPALAELLRECGVTRISLGAQTFAPRLLEVLERVAGPDDVRAAVQTLRDASFDNISLDLIYGIPGQEPSDLDHDLAEALALEPEHLSLYELEAKPGTRFTHSWGHELGLQAEAMEGYFERVVETLTSAGFRWYETANFCRADERAEGRDLRAHHNLGYWQGRDYLGVGIGAVRPSVTCVVGTALRSVATSPRSRTGASRRTSWSSSIFARRRRSASCSACASTNRSNSPGWSRSSMPSPSSGWCSAGSSSAILGLSRHRRSRSRSAVDSSAAESPRSCSREPALGVTAPADSTSDVPSELERRGCRRPPAERRAGYDRESWSSPRRREILRLVVEEHVATGQPVGSKSLVERDGMDVSSSTVRSELAELEAIGLLMHPHTSAGRIPTENGYRVYAEQLVEALDGRPERLTPAVAAVRSELEAALRSTTETLSQATRLLALVSAPALEAASVRHVDVLQLQPRAVIVVVISSTGGVMKRVLELEEPIDPGLVDWARTYLEEQLVGLRLGSATLRRRLKDPALPSRERKFLSRLRPAFVDAVGDDGPRLFFGGAAGLLGDARGAELEACQQLLDVLERRAACWSFCRTRSIRVAPSFVSGRVDGGQLHDMSYVGATFTGSPAVPSAPSPSSGHSDDYEKAIRAVRAAAFELSRLVEDVFRVVRPDVVAPSPGRARPVASVGPGAPFRSSARAGSRSPRTPDGVGRRGLLQDPGGRARAQRTQRSSAP